MRALSLCQACKRHIRSSETACPFCGAAHDRAPTAAPRTARGRPGGRAALFLAGVAAASGCGDDEEDVGGQPVYGIPIDASLDGGGADTGAQPDGGATTPDAEEPMAQPVYGVPIDAASDDAKDAGDKDAEEPVAVPVYGVPIDAGADDTDAEEPMGVPIYGIAIDDVER